MLQFSVDTLTLEELKLIIANGNDNYNNQIRCNNDRMIFLSENIVGNDSIDNIAFCFETFSAGNDYVGQKAANDEAFMRRLYQAIIDNREQTHSMKYIDIF